MPMYQNAIETILVDRNPSENSEAMRGSCNCVHRRKPIAWKRKSLVVLLCSDDSFGIDIKLA